MFEFLECRLGDVLGVSDSYIKKTRRMILVEGEDFDRVDKRIAYSKEGITKLLGFLRGTKKTAAGLQEKLGSIDESIICEMCRIQAVLTEKQAAGDDVQVQGLLAAPWSPPDTVLIVVKLCRNPRIIMARLDAQWIEKNGAAFELRSGTDPAGLQRIRVRSSEKFITGMNVPVKWIQDNLWACTRRMPRGRGKW